MKKIFFLLLILPTSALGIGPQSCTEATSTGTLNFDQVTEPGLIVTNGSCPTGTTTVLTTTDNINCPSVGSSILFTQTFCILYEPANTDISDSTGTYEYENEVCPFAE